MSMFTLAISYLTTSNLPWFMDLTFQFLYNTVLYCIRLYFYHVTSTTWHYFHFSSASSFFPELSLHSWAPTDLGSSFFSVIVFLPFHTVHGVLKQEYWSGLPFPSPVDHVLSELSTMTCPSWVALHSMAHSFFELDKAVVHVIRLVSFLWLWFSFCLPYDG